MRRDYRVYIHDILDAITTIEGYAEYKTLVEFLSNRMAIDAVVRNFEVIGEAAKRVPNSIRRGYPDVPWRKMAGIAGRAHT